MSKREFTPEEIFESLRVCIDNAENGCTGCVTHHLGGNKACDALSEAAADMIEAQAKRIAELEELVKDRTKDVLFYAEREKWIPVEERLPEVRASRWAQYLGTEQWEPWMNQQYSDYVEAVIAYDIGDGLKKKVHPAYVEDGEWRLPGGTYLRSYAKVECWRPMPKEPEAE